MTQKEIAAELDAMARRAAGRGTPATSKQCWFLAGLLLADPGFAYHGMNTVTCGAAGYILTVGRASSLINDLIAASKKAA